MSSINRRDALRLMAAAPLIGVLEWKPEELSAAALRLDELQSAGPAAIDAFAPEFFNPHEWRTVHVLADMIIPRDAKSGSATDAGVPAFIDFMMTDGSETRRTSMRAGLAWLDVEMQRRFGIAFVDATEGQRRTILNDVAWPARAPESMREGVTFFNSFRDLTAAGFFSSRIGYADLDFRGPEMVPQWNGCPPAALDKLGVSYDLMEQSQ